MSAIQIINPNTVCLLKFALQPSLWMSQSVFVPRKQPPAELINFIIDEITVASF
jgi:hypothetical protein